MRRSLFTIAPPNRAYQPELKDVVSAMKSLGSPTILAIMPEWDPYRLLAITGSHRMAASRILRLPINLVVFRWGSPVKTVIQHASRNRVMAEREVCLSRYLSEANHSDSIGSFMASNMEGFYSKCMRETVPAKPHSIYVDEAQCEGESLYEVLVKDEDCCVLQCRLFR